MVDRAGTKKEERGGAMNALSHRLTVPRPFVLSFEDDNVKHHEVLNSLQSINLHSGLVTLQPWEDVGLHTTGEHEELLVILDGVGEVQLGGYERQKIQKGCFSYIPPATQHNVFNTGTLPLRYVYVVSRVNCTSPDDEM
jgi:mannose-6-phosphate isomerase-like protein (cupin superfamily)